MTEFDEIDDTKFTAVDEETTTDDLDTWFADIAAENEREKTRKGIFNLVEDADMDCLNGDCDHFCGEPTQDDLDRLYAQGKGHLVEAYENNIHYI